MRVSTNDKLIRRRRRFGTYASLGGLAVLALGMVASLRMQYAWISLVALIIGFLLAQYGNYNLRRWGRSPRPDQVLEEALKGFDDRYHLYSWALPAPFVLLSPQGVYGFVTRDQTGQITSTGSQWRSKFSAAISSAWVAGLGPRCVTRGARSSAAIWRRSWGPAAGKAISGPWPNT